MKRPPGMPASPGVNLLGFVRRGVVEKDMHVAVYRELPGEGVEEVNELLWNQWRSLFCPITVTSRTFRAANRVVVPLRL